MISEGKHKARATGQVVLGKSANKGTPFIELYFRVSEGEHAGEEARWTGYFSNGKSGKVTVAERTIESLQFCGWKGDDVGEFADGDLHGLDGSEVQIVVEHEEYSSNGEDRVGARVAWVNRLGYLNVQNAMAKDDAAAFGDEMRGLVLKMKAKGPAKVDPDVAFPHGANVAPKATGTRKGW